MANENNLGVSVPEPVAPATIERLKTLVREHRVCWEVWPEQLAGVGRWPLQVDFDLVRNGAQHRQRVDSPTS